ncbi:hypothetical protein [Thiohalomonas denitrificans]|uniref:hypothetical protein n=1 Tax=Thiohalomonas denitrificans TaxID=415747 RepID=UPI0026EBFCE8|nr:hypothetical protein [Thiohalomonas denitrificans]
MRKYSYVRSSRIALAKVLLMVGFLGSSHAAVAEDTDAIGPKLTPRLQQLLTDEMRAVKQAMGHIMNGLITGDHAMVGSQAQQIRDSFILKKELTEEDKKNLMAAASPGFVKLDGSFHEMAGMLVQVATEKHSDLQTYYFGRMVEACQECHSQYATNKFPAFGGKQTGGHTH